LVTIVNIGTLKAVPMPEPGRGRHVALINPETGARSVDVHVNILRPGGPDGRYHYHPATENVYIVLGGTGRFVAEGKEYTLSRDDVVFIPPNVRHSLSARGDVEFTVVEIYSGLPAEMRTVD